MRSKKVKVSYCKYIVASKMTAVRDNTESQGQSYVKLCRGSKRPKNRLSAVPDSAQSQRTENIEAGKVRRDGFMK